MAISKEQKKNILAKLADIVKNPSLVFVNFHKVTVAEITDLRRTLRSAKVGYFVAKKTLIKKALEAMQIKGDLPSLDGEIAVAYSEDAVAPAREVYSFQKKLDNKVSLVGGIFEGQYRDKLGIMAIATIPGRETLYAQFAQLVNSPIQRLVIGLSEIAKTKKE